MNWMHITATVHSNPDTHTFALAKAEVNPCGENKEIISTITMR